MRCMRKALPVIRPAAGNGCPGRPGNLPWPGGTVLPVALCPPFHKRSNNSRAESAESQSKQRRPVMSVSATAGPAPAPGPAPATLPYALGKSQLTGGYRVMATIREFEDRVHEACLAGEIPGAVHLYAGQEAVAAGVCAHLDPEDYLASTHRGHGHAIAIGCDLTRMMLEIYG